MTDNRTILTEAYNKGHRAGVALAQRECEETDYRDQFAMAAITGGLAASSNPVYDGVGPPEGEAKYAYEVADAMLKEREKKNAG